MEVQDVAFSGLCSGLAVLTPEQKKSGVIVVDLGGGTTDYIAYANNVLAAAGTLGLGGDHVTNDIALAFNIPISQADRVKREAGSAVINVPNASQRIALPAEVGFQSRSLSLGSLNTVINARLDEMLGMIRKRLQQEMILPLIGAGIVLTGGGAHQKGVVQVAEEIFGLPCSIGKPRNVSGLATATEGPEYATCIGMVQYGFKTMLDHRQGAGLGAWIKGLFVK
jgi:cell division protein FtsA